MVRNYKRKCTRSGTVDEESMAAAIEDVMVLKQSIRKTAAKYNLKPSTLESRIMKKRQADGIPVAARTLSSKYTPHQVFSMEEESALVDYIIHCSKLHYGLTSIHTRQLAFQYAKANNLKYPSCWDNNLMAGLDWFAKFRHRNPRISLRKPENTSAARSFAFCQTNIAEFYQNLEAVFQKHKFTPDRIYNFDESGVTTVLNTPKVLADKSQKQVGQLVSAERGELVTFGGIICANGNTIPPIFIFPRVHFKDHFMEGAPNGSLGVATRSGWINSDIFVDVLRHIQKNTSCTKGNPILLLCDNHESHVSVEAVNYARENGIVYLSFPPHTTHRLQPLDVGVFGPFKAKLKVAFNDWHITNPGKTLRIFNIPKLCKLAYLESFTPKNIVSSFEKPGIWPFNKLAFDESDFAPAQVYNSSELGCQNAIRDTENIENIRPENDSVAEPNDNLPQAVLPSLLSQQQVSVLQMPSTSQVLVSPEMVRPYPKVQHKKANRKGREPGKSRIYTDTPEKERLEEIAKSKELKKKELERKKKAKNVKRALSMLEDTEDFRFKPIYTKKSKNIDSDSSDTDCEMSVRDSSDSWLSEVNENDCEDFIHESNLINPEMVKVDSFVLVKFPKKKSIVYYIGKVLHCYSPSEYRVTFLRKKPGCWNFIYPKYPDEATVYRADIQMVLVPVSIASTARTADILKFSADLSNYNVN